MKIKNLYLSRLLALMICFVFSITPQIHAQLIKRSDYSIELPAGSKLDPADPDIDIDHLTTANLPDGNSLTITVVDDVNNTEAVYKQTIANFEKLVSAKAEKYDLFDVILGQGVAVKGEVNGMKVVMIVGYKKGKKGFIFGASYLDAESKTSKELLLQTIKSFKEE